MCEMCWILCRFNDVKDVVTNVGIYVVNKEVEQLLSGTASEALGIITFNGKEGIVNSVTSERDRKTQKYPNVFEGVGMLNDYQVTLHVNENVPTVACPPRNVPFHHKARLDKEIAPWISNIVLASKDNGGVWVMIDMRQPKKAIKDTKVLISRAEDIRAELAVSKWFTKLNFRTAYHQLELSPGSRYLTVFSHGNKLSPGSRYLTVFSHGNKLSPGSRYLTVFSHANKLKTHTRLTMGCKPAAGELNKALRPLFKDIASVHIIHDDLILAIATEQEQEKVIQQILLISH